MGEFGSDLASLDFDFGCDEAVSCILCDEQFNVTTDSQPLLQHLLQNHNFVIGSVDEVPDIRQYVLYWGKLKFNNLRDYCVVWLTNSEPGARQPCETFYLLCDKLPEDKKLRNTLTEMKLKYLTGQKEKDRSDVEFSRKCIYCYKVITGGISNCFSHLTFDHKFSLGNPDNIVFGAKFLDLLEEQLQNLKCLYCEGTFKNHISLREHMRKKQHRSLNPKNKIYDKFYLLNYLKPGTPWEEVKEDLEKESESSSSVVDKEHARRYHEDQLWTDWREEETIPSFCLFCNYTTSKGPQGVYYHMHLHHNFNFESITRHHIFYQRVKIVNYIRTKVKAMQCPLCDDLHEGNESLLSHMSSYNHFVLPPQHTWDDTKYLVPVLENDELLCHLEDDDELEKPFHSSNSVSLNEVVLPEDYRNPLSSILSNLSIRNEIIRPETGPLDFTSMCLFCRYTSSGANAESRLFSHMNTIHCFNFIDVIASLTFYNQVKLINYIRLSTGKGECYYCGRCFLSTASMEEHRVNEGHNTLPDEQLYTDNIWLQPVLEEDGLLQSLHEDGDSDDDSKLPQHPEVIGEDITIPPSILSDPALRQEILNEISLNLYNSQINEDY